MIRLDSNLKEIERNEIYCMLNPLNIPAIGAFKTHKIPLSKIMKDGLFEPEFAREVNDIFTKNPETCVFGYNSIKFDDNRTRELFYRNMLDPYKREYGNGNSRYDVLKLTRALKVLKPDTILWPTREDGEPSMKLEDIAPLNNIIQENAHDAISDVEATIGLMEIIKEKEPAFFEYTMKLRNKAFVSSITHNKPFMMIGDGPSRDSMYTGVLLPIASHPQNKNSTICINVAAIEFGKVNDVVDKILSIPAEDLHEYIYTRDKEKKLPLMEIRTNHLPFVFTPALLKDEGVQERTGIKYNETMSNIRDLSNNPRFAELSKHAYKAFDRDLPIPDDVYGQVYGGFMNNMDKKNTAKMTPYNYSEWEEIAKNISDKRVPELVNRAIGNIDTDLLSEEGKASFEQTMRTRYNDLSGEYGETLPKFWYEAQETLSSKDTSDEIKEIVRELEKHVNYYASTFAPNLVAKKNDLIKEYGDSIKAEEQALENQKSDKKVGNTPSP
jgi:exodeoxyribonuclease-1